MRSHYSKINFVRQKNADFHKKAASGLYSNHVKAFVQFVGRPQLKNGNLWFKTGSCSASSESAAKT